MDTAIERDFAGGRFTFYLSLPAILAVERGPVTPNLRVREYPVSIFQVYDELGAGIGLDGVGNPVLLPGARVFAGDIHNILERALTGGNSGDRDGDQFEVDGKLALRLINENLASNFEAYALLVWDILHATIKGVSLKKKEAPLARPKPRRRSTAGKSSPTAASSD